MKTVHDMPKEEYELHLKEFGGFNDAPPNLKEISVEEFAISDFFRFNPSLTEYRQITKNQDGTSRTEGGLSIRLFFLDSNTGIAISNDFWAKTVKFYRFGCNHKFISGRAEAERRGIKLFSSQSARVCEKCGFLHICDSSD